jgi:hypothetical protein
MKNEMMPESTPGLAVMKKAQITKDSEINTSPGKKNNNQTQMKLEYRKKDNFTMIDQIIEQQKSTRV